MLAGVSPEYPWQFFFPETQFHLVDSINKKLTVVNEIAASLGLTNITTQHTRAEDIKNKQFDVIISRAVAPLQDLWRWSKPLIKKNKTAAGIDNPNGLICLKGGDLAKEIYESGCKPFIWEIDKIFPEEYFLHKYLLYQPIK
ncbi:MAG: RsmG family class I SAM-dependent methyltransferase [Ferruginibacter sp.]